MRELLLLLGGKWGGGVGERGRVGRNGMFVVLRRCALKNYNFQFDFINAYLSEVEFNLAAMSSLTRPLYFSISITLIMFLPISIASTVVLYNGTNRFRLEDCVYKALTPDILLFFCNLDTHAMTAPVVFVRVFNLI